MLELEQTPRIAVCDDKPYVHEQIKELIQEYVEVYHYEKVVVQSFFTGDALLKNEHEIDLLFLDIELGDASGIDIVPIVKEKFCNISIIFISSYMHYFIHSCRLNVFQFLVKPFDKRIFFEELDRFYMKYYQRAALYHVSFKGEEVEFRITEIIYIEAALRHLYIYHETMGKYEKMGQIGREEKELKQYGFIRCHNSYLVNARYVEKMRNQIIYLKKTHTSEVIEIPVSKNKVAQARKEYQNWLLEQEL